MTYVHSKFVTMCTSITGSKSKYIFKVHYCGMVLYENIPSPILYYNLLWKLTKSISSIICLEFLSKVPFSRILYTIMLFELENIMTQVFNREILTTENIMLGKNLVTFAKQYAKNSKSDIYISRIHLL